MEYTAEYTLKIKLSNVFLIENLSEEQVQKKLSEVGKRELTKYLSGYLLDPNKKVVTEEIIYNQIKTK